MDFFFFFFQDRKLKPHPHMHKSPYLESTIATKRALLLQRVFYIFPH